MAICLFCALFLAVGCSGRMGYGVMLWSIPEYDIADGDIVPIYIRSNIGKVYGIGVHDTEQKIEVPLWQITDPESKKDAEKTAERYAEYRYNYAKVKIDGLAVRSEAVTTAKQVYRLREDEILKILYKGVGQPVMIGANALEGDWMRVLTADGTIGWCFSYNLSIFDERKGFETQDSEGEQEVDEVLEAVLAKNWYPEYYRSMIFQNKINLNLIQPEYGFDSGLESSVVKLIYASLRLSYPYTGITKIAKNEYAFDDTPISMTIRNPELIVVKYTDESGFPLSYNLVTLHDVAVDDEELDEEGKSLAQQNKAYYVRKMISDEETRRLNQYKKIVSLGTDFSSSNYGKLNFTNDGSFTWGGYKRLVDSKIINGTTDGGSFGTGTASINYFLDSSLSNVFDGVLTFQFDMATDEVNFLYTIEENGLRLENISEYDIEDETLMRQSSNPLIMFFTKVQ